tara:strand:- start:197 stop:763 length:567 start_codon:yes stop_codon:yes gene_type:complete
MFLPRWPWVALPVASIFLHLTMQISSTGTHLVVERAPPPELYNIELIPSEIGIALIAVAFAGFASAHRPWKPAAIVVGVSAGLAVVGSLFVLGLNSDPAVAVVERISWQICSSLVHLIVYGSVARAFWNQNEESSAVVACAAGAAAIDVQTGWHVLGALVSGREQVLVVLATIGLAVWASVLGYRRLS